MSIPCDPWELFNKICEIETCEKFSLMRQEDASEFLVNLLTHWAEGSKMDWKLSDLFEGHQISKTLCCKCWKHSIEMQRWTVLSLSLDESKRDNSVDDLIHNYTREEWVDKTTNRCKSRNSPRRKKLII